MPTLPTTSELWAYTSSLWNFLAWAFGAALAVLEMARFFVRHDWEGWLRRNRWRFVLVVLIAAQFGAYQNVMKARTDDATRFRGEIAKLNVKIAELDARLRPPIQVYMRWPEAWSWNGQKYSTNAQIKLDDSALLEMPSRQYQRMDPMAFAPPTQRLTNIVVFLTFSRAVIAIDCDPASPPLARWVPNENNTFYSVINAINPGLGGNVEEAFCFTVDAPGRLEVAYTFGPAETAPVRGHFNIVVKERPTP